MADETAVADQTPEQEAQEVAATASAKAHAESLGIDISQIGGTGKDGKVTKADIEAAIAARPHLLEGGSEPTTTTAVAVPPDAPEVTATVTQGASGVWAVNVFTQHPDTIDVSVNGRAVWRGIP